MPFLFAVALLFIGLNSIGHLKTYHPIDVVTHQLPDGKEVIDTVYHEVKSFQLKPYQQDSIIFPADSSNLIIGFFNVDSMKHNRKQFSYVSNLIERYSGIEVHCVFSIDESDLSNHLIKDDLKLFNDVKSLHLYTLPPNELNNVKKGITPDGKPLGFYTLVDQNKHVRGYFDIEELKKVREIVNHLKVLDAEFYEIEKKEIVQKRK